MRLEQRLHKEIIIRQKLEPADPKQKPRNSVENKQANYRQVARLLGKNGFQSARGLDDPTIFFWVDGISYNNELKLGQTVTFDDAGGFVISEGVTK